MDGFQLLSPAGTVAEQELSLIHDAALLMLITTIAVFALLIFFGWWYRASNTKALYLPEWEHGALSELVWWAIPVEIVLILGALTWTSTHELDPWKRLDTIGDPLVVEVVALEWKWLFIYPEEEIASVNELYIPVDRPVTFRITADAPMNAFWIPRLGGMVYAMTGMATELNLIARASGIYPGSSSNYSGEGFAEMKFLTHAVSNDEYLAWIQKVKKQKDALTGPVYQTLREPTIAHPITYYATVSANLFDAIVMQYMPRGIEHSHAH